MMSSGMSVTVRDLRVVRGGATILHDINLDIERGALYGLVGPSGSGKTTLIRSIIGRQRIAGGAIQVDDLPAGSAALRDRIGYLPQDAAIYPELTGRENFQFFAAIVRAAPGRVDEVLDLLDLRAIAGRPVTTYSGGQVRRIALGVALLASPPILMLDEPTVGLDPRLRHRLWSEFADWAAGGTTLVITTHVMEEAARVDRLAFLSEGRVVAEGSPAELLAKTGAADLEAALLRLTEPADVA
jgi:ABC-2 type transport system ATP-binding protein